MILSRGNLQGPADQWEEEEPLHLISVWQETGEWRNSADADITIFYNIWYHGVNRIRKIDHWMISRKQSNLTNIRIIIKRWTLALETALRCGLLTCGTMWGVTWWRGDTGAAHIPATHLTLHCRLSYLTPHTSHLNSPSPPSPLTSTLLLTLHLTPSSNLLLSFAS